MANRLYNKQVSPKGYKKGGKIPASLNHSLWLKRKSQMKKDK